MRKSYKENSLSVGNITERISGMYGASESDFISGRIDEVEQKEMLCEALRSIAGGEEGRLFFPNTLYDGMKKKIYRAENRRSLNRLRDMSHIREESLYKYIIPIKHYTPRDNVWSRRTVGKARTVEEKFFERLGYPSAPRLPKLERQAREAGGFHLQGVVTLPAGRYPSQHFQELNGDIFEWGVYLAKVSEQALERDRNNQLVSKNLPLAISSLQTWYLQTLRNRRDDIERNPSTAWRVSIPNEKRVSS